MVAVLSDYNLTGHAAALTARLGQQPWVEFRDGLGISVMTFADLGLAEGTPDDVIWRRCQADGLILMTANRNHDDPTSLEAVIRAENGPGCLPVITIADADWMMWDRAYLDRVIDGIIDRVMNLDNLRGTGRLYLP